MENHPLTNLFFPGTGTVTHIPDQFLCHMELWGICRSVAPVLKRNRKDDPDRISYGNSLQFIALIKLIGLKSTNTFRRLVETFSNLRKITNCAKNSC